MRKLSFVNPNFQQGPKELNAYYLPYSAGVLLSYAFKDPEIRSSWEIADLIWRRDPIEETARRLADHDVIALSTYVWNHKYNYTLGKRIKELNPKALIVAGGPEPAITDPELFRKNPWMDMCVTMEGEITFKKILENFGGDYSKIPGILINDNGNVVNTGTSARIEVLDDIPSPYFAGIFDKLIEQYPDIEWHGTLETNRGCPYSCTFCDWGSLTYNKVKKFDLDRVLSELEWLGERCGYLTVTDANFGMFVERDDVIIDKLIAVQRKWMKLKNFSITWAKNQKNEVVNIVTKLIKESPFYGAGLTVSVQSMDTNVLEIIKRKNLQQHKIDEIFSLCAKKNVPVYSELILGLPGDSEKTWKESVWAVFRSGNHYGVNILHAALLENAEMNLQQRAAYQMESVSVYDYMSGTYSDGELDETVEIVIGTKDLPKDAMLRTMVWNSFIQAFHINGLTTYIARYLHATGTDYSVFYDKLYAHLNSEAWFQKEFSDTKGYYEEWTKNGYVHHAPIGRVEVRGWNLHNRLTWRIYNEGKVPYVFEVVQKFLEKEFPLAILPQLIDFQRSSVIEYENLTSLPLVRSFDYDFLGFLHEGSPLNARVSYSFDTTENKAMSFQMFLENFWFGRKRNFGRARINTLEKIASRSVA